MNVDRIPATHDVSDYASPRRRMHDLDHAFPPFVFDYNAVLSEPAALSGSGPDAALPGVAIQRNGRAAGEVGGRAAMRRAITRAAELAPDRSRRREVVMALAWAGLPGW